MMQKLETGCCLYCCYNDAKVANIGPHIIPFPRQREDRETEKKGHTKFPILKNMFEMYLLDGVKHKIKSKKKKNKFRFLFNLILCTRKITFLFLFQIDELDDSIVTVRGNIQLYP